MGVDFVRVDLEGSTRSVHGTFFQCHSAISGNSDLIAAVHVTGYCDLIGTISCTLHTIPPPQAMASPRTSTIL